MEGWGTPALSMKLCCCVGNVHTVVWCVVGGEYELGVYDDGGHIVVYTGSVHSCWG